MWIFSRYGFFSVTQHPDRKDNVQIRARTDRDLQALKDACPTLSRCPIHRSDDADYRFRMVVQRWRWELVAEHLAESIDYSNFKGKIHQIPEQRHKLDILHRIWSIMHAYQCERHDDREQQDLGQSRLFREAGDPLLDDNLDPDPFPDYGE